IADITSVCLLMKKLAPSKVVASPVHTGYGKVHCAHGILPVPAPATATILKGIPSLAGNIEGELCTPTGAALLKHFVNEFAQMPAMRTEAIGYGMGTKDFAAANCLRAFLGKAEVGIDDDYKDEIYELSCNIDDMSGEEIAFAAERLFETGALDVFTAPINMKKGRPGMLISILCREENKSTLVEAIFKYTTTLGIREAHCTRYILKREIEETETLAGVFRAKHSEGYGIRRSKLEYEDLARLAGEKNINLREAKELAEELNKP
ncbi:MAG: LarC family nickel insertion protein, partial [Clostridiales bacterium]|nr:LarC family nickel insertion protein [Clostridiales bacterium]